MERVLDEASTGEYGLFGGIFDPVHYGHLYVAEAVRDELGLAYVVLAPARIPPHKDSAGVAPAEDRVEMVRLATAGNPGLVLCTLEVERPGPSYTYDTIDQLTSTYGRPPVLILGVDAFLMIETWYRWAELVRRVPFALVARPRYDTKKARKLAERIGAEVACLIESAGVDVSSTLIRQRISEGKTIRYLTPDPVVEYLARCGAYVRDGTDG